LVEATTRGEITNPTFTNGHAERVEAAKRALERRMFGKRRPSNVVEKTARRRRQNAIAKASRKRNR
jgi:hypothetical protein